MKFIFKYLTSILLVSQFGVCWFSANATEDNTTSHPASPTWEKDYASVLANRGFYISEYGDLNYIEGAGGYCAGMQVQSHRGAIRMTENSISSIEVALKNGFEVVEIDVRKLRDDTWVLHHDSKTGRATNHHNGEFVDINRMKLADFAKLKLVHPRSKSDLQERPPTFAQAAQHFARHSTDKQSLNIELKSYRDRYDREDVVNLYRTAKYYIPKGNFYFSSTSLKALGWIRELDSDVYLGLVQGALKESGDKLKSDVEGVVSGDALYHANRYRIKWAEWKYDKRYRPQNINVYPWELKEKLGSNVGLHLDVRQYARKAREYSDALWKDVQFFTYSINGQGFHEEQLKSLPRDQLPDGAIIDDTLYGFCKLFDLPPHAPSEGVTDELAKLIDRLPADYDVERLKDLREYHSQGLYPGVEGRYRPIPPKASAESAKGPEKASGRKKDDEPFTPMRAKRVKVRITKDQ